MNLKTIHLVALILVGLGTGLPASATKAPPQFVPWLVLAGVICGAVGGAVALATQPPTKDDGDKTGGAS